MHCNDEYTQAKLRLREQKRLAKQQRRDEKRQAKERRREEKRKEKQDYCEIKRYFRNEFRNYFMQPSTSHNNVVIGYPGNSNVHYNNCHDERIEHDVAAVRTIFPDCDPEYIRNCLANETVDHKRKVTEKLLTTDYPKVAPVSPATMPSAPPLPSRSSCDLPHEEAPPSYEESLGSSSFLQPPQLPKRHNRSSSWNGTSITQSQPTQPTQQTRSTQQTESNSQRSYANYSSTEVADAITSAVKNFLAGFKPSSVQQACHKSSHILMRPVPSRCNPQQLSEVIKVTPKDKYSIQRGFNSGSYPTRKLRHNDVSEEDWYFFISGLNSIIGANSINGSTNNLGDGFSVSLKWVSWMKVTMDEKLMDSNIDAINEYLIKWNINFFNPRKMTIEIVDDRTPKTVSTGLFQHKETPFEQYLLIKSI